MASKHSPLLIFFPVKRDNLQSLAICSSNSYQLFSLTKAFPKKIFALRSGKNGSNCFNRGSVSFFNQFDQERELSHLQHEYQLSMP